MKTLLKSIIPLIAITSSAVASSGKPTGYLNVSESLVRATGSVVVDWKVDFPEAEFIDELIDIDPEEDTITTETAVNLKVRLIGCGYANSKGEYGYLESWSKFSDRSYPSNFFTGYGDDVDPNEVMIDRKVEEGVELNFAFRGAVSATRSTPWYQRTFNDWRVMGVGHGGIVILKDGDAAPTFSPEQPNQTSAQTFLSPYLSDDASEIQIGSRDIIVLVDLNKDSEESGADYQDYVILLTFDEYEEN